MVSGAVTTFVVPAPARAATGDTLMVNGRPLAVAVLLPRLPGRRQAARVTPDPPCGACERALRWDVPQRCWRCPDCRQTYDSAALADLLTEHVSDGVCVGNARRDRERRARQVRRGAPGAAALLLRAAAAGGALSRAALVEATSGPEKRALRWALRDDGDRPLSAERCRAAAADLARLTPGDLAGA